MYSGYTCNICSVVKYCALWSPPPPSLSCLSSSSSHFIVSPHLIQFGLRRYRKTRGSVLFNCTFRLNSLPFPDVAVASRDFSPLRRVDNLTERKMRKKKRGRVQIRRTDSFARRCLDYLRFIQQYKWTRYERVYYIRKSGHTLHTYTRTEL